MAAVGLISLPANNLFHARSHYYHMDAHRTSDALPGYPSKSYLPASRSPQEPAARSAVHYGAATPALENAFKPSLPSISNLLGYASADRPGKIAGPTESPFNERHVPQTQSRPQISHSENYTLQQDQAKPVLLKPLHAREISMNQHVLTPPTPPFRHHDSAVQTTRSPSVLSTRSSASAVQPSLLPSILNNPETHDLRSAHPPSLKRPSFASQPDASPPHKASRLSLDSPYTVHSPSALSISSQYSSPQARQLIPRTLLTQVPVPAPAPSALPTTHHPPGPLPSGPAPPSSHPPPPPHDTTRPPLYPTTNPWEHHHYISPSAQAAFPPSPDRYVCPRCSKAFSRPSSLKIHSHSHTGEKPFKCPHAGCEKAFSVRSNMKRHERGCHANPLAVGVAAEGSRAV